MCLKLMAEALFLLIVMVSEAPDCVVYCLHFVSKVCLIHKLGTA